MGCPNLSSSFQKPVSNLGAQAYQVRSQTSKVCPQVINPLVQISAQIVDALVVEHAGDVNRDHNHQRGSIYAAVICCRLT